MFCVPLTPALSLKGRGSYRLASDLIRWEGEKTLDSCFRRNDGFGVSMPIFISTTSLGCVGIKGSRMGECMKG